MFSPGDWIALGLGTTSTGWGCFQWWEKKQEQRRNREINETKRITQDADSLDTIQGQIKLIAKEHSELAKSHTLLRDSFLRHEAGCEERQKRIDDNVERIFNLIEGIQAQISNMLKGVTNKMWEIKPGE